MAVFWVVAPCSPWVSLMMEVARTSETLVNSYQITWRYNPEDSHLRTHRRENLKSYKGNIVYKSEQICACADDIVLVTRNTPTLKELPFALETEDRKMGQRIFEEKTKFMKMSSK
jgi:hypothetical protein